MRWRFGFHTSGPGRWGRDPVEWTLVHQGLSEVLALDGERVTAAIVADYGGGEGGVPGFLNGGTAGEGRKKRKKQSHQGRHVVEAQGE